MRHTPFYRFKDILDSTDYCCYCGTYLCEWEKVIDHFYPVSAGGGSIKGNLFVSCRECNAIKSDHVFESHSDARSWILPKKRSIQIIGRSEIIYPEQENDESQIIVTNLLDEKYYKLKLLHKYDSFTYVIGIGNIHNKRLSLVKEYLFEPFYRLGDEIQLLNLLNNYTRQKIITHNNIN